MEALEGKVLATPTPAPKVFYRYVHDCFCILKKQDLQRFLDCLNAQNVNIQYRAPGWERSRLLSIQEAHTHRSLSLSSHHPIGHKTSAVSSLVTRSVRLCSDEGALKSYG
ncbi:hypothetical protein HPB50_028922 [Hyalomma asiaticum]|nr:hypothetical protein HPB50_028922 [Hyalomma asiaticum]